MKSISKCSWGLEAYIYNVYELCWPMYTDLERPGDTFAVAGAEQSSYVQVYKARNMWFIVSGGLTFRDSRTADLISNSTGCFLKSLPLEILKSLPRKYWSPYPWKYWSPYPGNTDVPTPGNTDVPTPGNTEVPTPGNTDVPTPGNTDVPTPGNTEALPQEILMSLPQEILMSLPRKYCPTVRGWK